MICLLPIPLSLFFWDLVRNAWAKYHSMHSLQAWMVSAHTVFSPVTHLTHGDSTGFLCFSIALSVGCYRHATVLFVRVLPVARQAHGGEMSTSLCWPAMVQGRPRTTDSRLRAPCGKQLMLSHRECEFFLPFMLSHREY